jgi:precorrin-6B methylase 1
MARKLIPKNAGKFKVSLSMIGTYIVTNDKSGGNRIIIPCKSKEQAEKVCKQLNERNENEEFILWI